MSSRTSPRNKTLIGRLRFLFTDAAIYGFANAVSKSMALITFPLLARNLSVAQYGSVDLAIAAIGFLSTVLIFGQDSAVARFFYDDERVVARQEAISMSFFFQIFLLFVFLPCLWLFISPLVEARHFGENFQFIFSLVILQVPSLLLINFSQNILKWSFQRKKFLYVTLGYSIFHATIIISLILNGPISPLDVIVSGFVSSALFAILGLYFVKHWFIIPKNWKKFIPMFHYAWPLGVVCFLAAALPFLERVIVVEAFGQDDLGLYAAALKICMIFSLFHAAFQTAWGPFSLSIFKEDLADATFNQVARLVSCFSCLLILGISIIAHPIITLLAGEQYSGASILVAPIGFSLVLGSVAMVLEIGIGIAKRPVFSMLAYLAGITVTFGGLQFFIFYLGIIGVPLAVFLGVSVKVLISANLAQRVYPIRWDFLSIAGFMGGAIFSWSLAYWFFLMNNQSSYYVILFFSMLVYMVLTVREIKLLKSTHLMMSVS